MSAKIAIVLILPIPSTHLIVYGASLARSYCKEFRKAQKFLIIAFVLKISNMQSAEENIFEHHDAEQTTKQKRGSDKM